MAQSGNLRPVGDVVGRTWEDWGADLDAEGPPTPDEPKDE